MAVTRDILMFTKWNSRHISPGHRGAVIRWWALLILILSAGTLWAQPIRLHPDNPHYFLWNGEPTILITSGEHYGAVLNRAFDYETYLQTLHSHGFNLTRTFSGAYCEPAGAFKIRDNTLAPGEGQLLCPWKRSDTTGYTEGGNKFDLTEWDPQYFARLRDFVATADQQGVVVELVLFCPFYRDAMWELSPMNARNNVNGIGDLNRTDVYTLKNKQLTGLQERMVEKIVTELQGFDNLYYEICNEPYFGGVTLDWQRHIADIIVRTEEKLQTRHLIAQNIANGSAVITDPNPEVDIFNFHYAKPPTAVTVNYHLGKAIADDETGFSGSGPKPYRLEGWGFILAGGAVYDNLDYSYTVGHEDGTAEIQAPGDGGPVFRDQLEILRDFITGFDFINMVPDSTVILNSLPDSITVRVLAEEGSSYALYVKGNGLRQLRVRLPDGKYTAEWVNTKTGGVNKSEVVRSTHGQVTLECPRYRDGTALRIRHR